MSGLTPLATASYTAFFIDSTFVRVLNAVFPITTLVVVVRLSCTMVHFLVPLSCRRGSENDCESCSLHIGIRRTFATPLS